MRRGVVVVDFTKATTAVRQTLACGCCELAADAMFVQ